MQGSRVGYLGFGQAWGSSGTAIGQWIFAPILCTHSLPLVSASRSHLKKQRTKNPSKLHTPVLMPCSLLQVGLYNIAALRNILVAQSIASNYSICAQCETIAREGSLGSTVPAS